MSPLSPASWPNASDDRQQLLRRGLNILSDPYLAETQANAMTLTSGTIWGIAIGLRAGDVVTNVLCTVTTAAAGTVPTLMRLGIADSTQKIVALTADVKSDAQWLTNSWAFFPLSAPYTATADGLYYLALIKTGTFGTTEPQVRRQSTAGILPALTGGKIGFGAQTGQTDLPTVGNTMTLAQPGSNPIYLGCN